jgi:hypothetical protein
VLLYNDNKDRKMVKIKINEKENYNIEIPDEISSQEFLGLMSRLDIISKMILKGSPLEIEPVQIGNKNKTIAIQSHKKGRGHRVSWGNDRDKVIRYLKAQYHGSKQDKEKISEIEGQEWEDIMRSLWYYRNKFEIKPQEVGMKRFLKQSEGGMRKLKEKLRR